MVPVSQPGLAARSMNLPMSQDSEQRHLAAIDVERERDGLHLKILKHVPLMIALHLRMFSTHTLTHTHTCVCVYKYIYIYYMYTARTDR